VPQKGSTTAERNGKVEVLRLSSHAEPDIIPVDCKHRDHRLEDVAQQGENPELFPQQPRHIGGADIAAAGFTDINPCRPGEKEPGRLPDLRISTPVARERRSPVGMDPIR
jgi:hypothetical protein